MAMCGCGKSSIYKDSIQDVDNVMAPPPTVHHPPPMGGLGFLGLGAVAHSLSFCHFDNFRLVGCLWVLLYSVGMTEGQQASVNAYSILLGVICVRHRPLVYFLR